MEVWTGLGKSPVPYFCVYSVDISCSEFLAYFLFLEQKEAYEITSLSLYVSILSVHLLLLIST
jgi:hypothetical protein